MVRKLVKFASKGFIPLMIWLALNQSKIREMLKDGQLDEKEQEQLEKDFFPYFEEDTDEIINGLVLFVLAIDLIKKSIKTLKA